MIPHKRPRGRPLRFKSKTLQFNLRMSKEFRERLDHYAKLGGRPLSYQIEHMVTLASMLVKFCDGSDNLQVVENKLKKAQQALDKLESRK
jgi:predicted DNA-binding protein